MSKFIDSKDREWDISFTIPKFIKVTRRLNISLGNLTSGDLQVADMLEAIPLVVADQMDKHKVSEADFFDPENIAIDRMMDLMNCFMAAINEAFGEKEESKEGDSEAPLDLGK